MSVIAMNPLDYIETPGGNAGVGIATRSRGATEVSVIRQRQAPGGSNPVHTHDREEVLVLLTGSISVTLGDESHALSAGDAIIVPAGTPHHIANPGGEPAEWLLIAPAGVRFLHASGQEATPPWAR